MNRSSTTTKRTEGVFMEKRAKSFDGIELAYQMEGTGSKVIVLANGLGGTYPVWRRLVEYFRSDYRILSWDYRGLHNSQIPKDWSTLSIEHHCKDLAHILELEEIDHAILVGWSMGVQVILQFYDLYPDKVEGLIPINGTFGYPFDTLFNSSIAKYFAPTILSICQRLSKPLEVLLFVGTLYPKRALSIMQLTGLISKTCDREIFAKISREFPALDMAVYCQICKELGQHTAFDVLERIEVPTLIISSDRDLFTPVTVAQEMYRLISGSRLVVIPKGTHYAPIEYPDAINEAIDRFLQEEFSQSGDSSALRKRRKIRKLTPV